MNQKIFSQAPSGKNVNLKLLLTMKLIVFSLTIFCIQASAVGFSQKNITVAIRNAELSKIFSTIQKQGDYRFLYHDDKELKGIRRNLEVDNVPLSQVMDQLLLNTNFKYRLVNSNLVVISQWGIFYNQVGPSYCFE